MKAIIARDGEEVRNDSKLGFAVQSCVLACLSGH